MVIDPNVENSLRTKRRKLKSRDGEDFTKYVGKDEKEQVKCKHCKKECGSSNKSEITYLKNHLKSCPSLKNANGVAEQIKEKKMIGPNLNNSNLVQRIIKYGLNAIKTDAKTPIEVILSSSSNLFKLVHNVIRGLLIR